MTDKSLSDFVATVIEAVDPEFTAISPGYADAAIMIASLSVGADEDAIVDGLGYDPEFVALVGNRLRTAKIWIGNLLDRRAYNRWNGKDGGIALVCDTNVAMGRFTIAKYKKNEPIYSLSPEGKRSVEAMLRRPSP